MKKTVLRQIMLQAWQFVKRNGFTMRDAMIKAWRIFKLDCEMRCGIVKFYYQKVDGSIREAYGTLKQSLIDYNPTGTERKHNDSVFSYWDTEKQAYRCFKKANII